MTAPTPTAPMMGGADAEALADLRQHVTHLIYAIDRGYFSDDGLRASAFVAPLRAYANGSFKPIARVQP